MWKRTIQKEGWSLIRIGSLDANEVRFTSRSIKKYSASIYDRRALDSEFGHDLDILEVLDIAKACKIVVKGVKILNFLNEFYVGYPNRLKYLRNAPKRVQQQYLLTFNDSLSYGYLERFMEVAEVCNYTASLLSHNSEFKKYFRMNKANCIIPESVTRSELEPSEFNISFSEAKDIAFNITYLINKGELNRYEEMFKQNGRNYNNSDRYNPVMETINDQAVNHIFISSCHLLVEKYGSEVISEVLERYDKTTSDISLSVIYYLLANWSEAEDYPIEWTLAGYPN